MKMKRRMIALLVVLLLAAVSYWGYVTFFHSDKEFIMATGTIEATSVELTAKMSGVIESLTVEEGDKVDQGQVVARIKRKDLEAQRDGYLMALRKAEQQLADLVSGARDQELEQALSSVNIARAAWEQAKENLEKRKALFEQGAISEEELANYVLLEETARNKLKAAEAQYSLLAEGSRSSAIEAAKAEVERNRAVLAASEAALEDLAVVSPLAGVVTSRNYEPGELVQAGASLATVADLNDLWIKVYIPTDDLPDIRLGQVVTFTVSGAEGSFKGKVAQIASRGEFTPKAIQTQRERANVVFAVKITVDDPKGILKPGMPADVVLKRISS